MTYLLFLFLPHCTVAIRYKWHYYYLTSWYGNVPSQGDLLSRLLWRSMTRTAPLQTLHQPVFMQEMKNSHNTQYKCPLQTPMTNSSIKYQCHTPKKNVHFKHPWHTATSHVTCLEQNNNNKHPLQMPKPSILLYVQKSVHLYLFAFFSCQLQSLVESDVQFQLKTQKSTFYSSTLQEKRLLGHERQTD